MGKLILLLSFIFICPARAGPWVIEPVDQVIRKDRKLYFFRFASWQVQVWDTVSLRKWIDNSAVVPGWENIPRPQGPFQPLRVVPGQSWNFLVLDAGERRLWQLDSALQILSSMPLPEEVAGEDLEAMRFFHSHDNRFTFVNIAEGQVIQYQEIAGKLVFRQRIQITLSCRGLFQAAWRAGDTGHTEFPFICETRKGPLAYNLFFNQKKAITDSLMRSPAVLERPVLLSGVKMGESGRFILTYSFGAMAFCFQPEEGRFYYCSEN